MGLWDNIKRAMGVAPARSEEPSLIVQKLLPEDGDTPKTDRKPGAKTFIDVDKLPAPGAVNSMGGDDDAPDVDLTDAPNYIIEDVHLPQTVPHRLYALTADVIQDIMTAPLEPAVGFEDQRSDVSSLFLALSDAAQIGDADGCFLAGAMILKGLGQRTSPGEATRLIWLGAQKGSGGAEFLLGRLLEVGQGTQRDEEQATLWLEKAAVRGLRYAELHLARKYEHGDGVAADLGKAMTWYRKAATHGLQEAQFRLATILWHGEKGIRRDIMGALEWYQRAADSGHEEAYMIVGRAFADGVAGNRDPLQAAHYLALAADAGYGEAKVILAHLILESSQPNLAEAERLLRSAVEQGYETARVPLAEVEDLQAKQLAERHETESKLDAHLSRGYQADVPVLTVHMQNVISEIRADADEKLSQVSPWRDAGRALGDAVDDIQALLPTISTDQPIGDYIRQAISVLEHARMTWQETKGDNRGYGSAAFLEVIRAMREVYLTLPEDQRPEVAAEREEREQSRASRRSPQRDPEIAPPPGAASDGHPA